MGSNVRRPLTLGIVVVVLVVGIATSAAASVQLAKTKPKTHGRVACKLLPRAGYTTALGESVGKLQQKSEGPTRNPPAGHASICSVKTASGYEFTATLYTSVAPPVAEQFFTQQTGPGFGGTPLTGIGDQAASTLNHAVLVLKGAQVLYVAITGAPASGLSEQQLEQLKLAGQPLPDPSAKELPALQTLAAALAKGMTGQQGSIN